MGLPVSELLVHAMDLPDDERIELAEAILSSVAPAGAPPFDAAWLAEARRRAARIDAGEGTLRSWDEVRENAWRRVAGDSGV